MDQASFIPLVPLSVLAGGIVLTLLAGLGRRSTAPERVRLRVLAVAVATLLATVTSAFALWPCASGAAGNFMVFDTLTTFFAAFVATVLLVGLLLGRHSKELDPELFGEWAALLLALGFGLILMAGARDLLMTYLAIETVSIVSYILTAFRKKDPMAHEAALKYVIYGGVASGVMLFGMSLLYGLAGATDFSAVATVLSPTGPLAGAGKMLGLGVFALILMVLTGLGYKIATVPFHMWCPDVYQGAPTPFTALLSVGPKAAGFVLLLRLLSSWFSGDHGVAPDLPWQALLGVLAAATMTLGNLSALVQTNVKRLLAYSSIAHAGYMLMAVTALGSDAAAAVLLYLLIYLAMNLGAFAAVQTVQDAVGHTELEAFRGLGSRSPFVAVALAIFLFSLTGLPPLAGFIGKFYLFAAVIHEGGFFFVLLAIIGLLNSAVSLYYYARVIRMMFVEKADDLAPLSLCRPTQLLVGLLLLPVLIFGLYWEPLRQLSQYAAAALFP